MAVTSPMLLQAMEIYLRLAYPGDGGGPPPPPGALKKVEAVRGAGDVPLSDPGLAGVLEKNDVHPLGRAVRLGQPLYPHMKLAIDPMGGGGGGGGGAGECDIGGDCVFRVDAHDRHLHAAPGSADEAWLSRVRRSNQELVEHIETAWDAAGLPTFRGRLRRELAARRAAAGKAGGAGPGGGGCGSGQGPG